MKSLSLAEFKELARKEWIESSGIDPGIFDLNVKIIPEISWNDGNDPSFPIEEFLNRKTIRFSREAKNRDGFAWICCGLDPLNGWGRMDWGCAKLSNPFFDKAKGKARKYEHPSGTPTRAFFLDAPRHIWEKIAERFGYPMPEDPQISFWQWVQGNHIPILVTEGAKKAASLLSAGYVAIALPGIWNARRVVRSDSGTILKESLIPELAPFLGSGRAFYFCFDREIKPKVAKAVALATIKTANLLIKAKCKAYVCKLPASANGKNGIDDFLVAGGNFDEIFENAPSFAAWQWNYRQSKALTLKPSVQLNTPDLWAINLELPESGLIAISSGKGTGKSKLIAQAIANEDENVIAQGHRICLMRSSCEQWGLDYRGDLDKFNGEFISGAGYSSRVGACIDSILSFNPEKFKGYTLIIDEECQVLLHLLTSSTCQKDGKRPAILARFEQLIKGADRVIIADADLDDRTIRYIQKLRGEEEWPLYLIRNDYKLPGYPVDFYLSKDPTPVIARLLKDAANGEKIFVATDSKKDAEAIAKRLEESGLNMLLISSDTSGDEIQQAFIKDPNHRLSDWDCVICTPSLATGVSIEAEHFTKVYGLYFGTNNDADIAQSLIRVRHPIPRVVWVSERGNNFSKVSRDTYPLGIKNTLRKAWNAELSLIRASLQPDTAQFLAQPYSWDDNPHLNLWGEISADQNISMWHYRENVLARLKSEGHQIRIIEAEPDKSTKAKMKSTKEEIKAAKCEAIAKAPELNPEQRSALEKKESLTKEEKESLSKAAIADFYAIEQSEVTDELVESDDEGRKRREILELEALQHGSSSAIQRDIKGIEKQAAWDKDIWVPDLPKYELRRAVREKLGLNQFLIPGKEYTDEDLEGLANFARKYSREIKTYLGFTIPSDSELATPIWIFRRFLDQLGIRTAAKRVGQDKKRVCWIASESWQKTQKIIARRTARYESTSIAETQTEQDLMVDTPPYESLYKTEGGVHVDEKINKAEHTPIQLKVGAVVRQVGAVGKFTVAALRDGYALIQDAGDRLADIWPVRLDLLVATDSATG